MIHHTLRPALPYDLAGWLELAREVEPLFGPMPDIDQHILCGIDRGTALVVAGPQGGIAGAALLSRDGTPHRINWLAVRASARRQGIGSALLKTILDRWNDEVPIDVITFGADNVAGRPARDLYRAHGFTFQENNDPGPEGGSRERWRYTRGERRDDQSPRQ